MSFMTKIEGVPDTDTVKPGMAFFAGSGPYGKTCGDCRFRGMYRESRVGKWNEERQAIEHRTYRTTQCAMFKKLAGHAGGNVEKDWEACKYFEAKEAKKKVAPSPQETARD